MRWLFLLIACPTVLMAALPNTLVFDAMSKEVYTSPTETNGIVVFNVTNVATKPITIFRLKPSCGCTLTEAPKRPWKLTPGSSGSVRFSTDTRGKFGRLNKTATLYTSAGLKILNFTIHIPHPLNSNSRHENLVLAEANRQSVFKGDCANCHARPTRHKLSKELFATACGICHESPRRADMVPTIAHRTLTTDQWHQLISNGKPNSLMPAFAREHGGPLSDRQIRSLARYMADGFSIKDKD